MFANGLADRSWHCWPGRFRPMKLRYLRSKLHLYNPTLKDDCFFECMAFQLMMRKPRQVEVTRIRALFAEAWTLHPEALALSAQSEGLTPDQYTDAIRSKLWEGEPEVDLLQLALGVKVCVLRNLDAHCPSPRYATSDKHLTLVQLSNSPQWHTLKPVTRRRTSQISPPRTCGKPAKCDNAPSPTLVPEDQRPDLEGAPGQDSAELVFTPNSTLANHFQCYIAKCVSHPTPSSASLDPPTLAPRRGGNSQALTDFATQLWQTSEVQEQERALAQGPILSSCSTLPS
eukprot:5637686-Amphidinium_carterae.2